MKITKLTDHERRELILTGNLWRVVLMISLPLALYNSFNQLFGIFDTMIAAQLGADSVSAIAYLNQIQIMMNSFGGAIAVGGSIIIARHIGAGALDAARKTISTLFALALVIGLIILTVMVPFAEEILRLSGAPEELIVVGLNYFRVEIVMIVIMFINSVFIAIEKAKGKTQSLFLLNVCVMILKLSLTLFFVNVLGYGVTMMAVASLIAHGVITLYAIRVLFDKKTDLKFSFKEISLSKVIIKPVFGLSLPIFFEKFLFSFGKVIVNAMSAGYGSNVVGALGISNTLGGIVTSPTNGIGDGAASVISQNVGNKNTKRALEAFKITFIINMIIGTVGFILMTLFMDWIIGFYAGGNLSFAREIHNIYYYERIAAITLAMSSSVMGLLYGFGFTRFALYLSMLRLFAFRIPTLYFMMHFTNLGSESVGIAMMVSNGLVGFASLIAAWIIIKRIKNGDYQI